MLSYVARRRFYNQSANLRALVDDGEYIFLSDSGIFQDIEGLIYRVEVDAGSTLSQEELN